MSKYRLDQHYTTDDGRIFVVTNIETRFLSHLDKCITLIMIRFLRGGTKFSFEVNSAFDERCEALPFQIGQKYINKKTDSAKDSEPFIVTEIKYGTHDNNEAFVVYRRLKSGTYSQFGLTSLFAGKCTPHVESEKAEKFEVGKVFVNHVSAGRLYNGEPFVITDLRGGISGWIGYRHLKSGISSTFMIGSPFANDSIPYDLKEQIYGPGGYEEQIAALREQLKEEKQAADREAKLVTHMANDCNDAQAEVKRLRKALQLIVDLDDAMGHNLNKDDAFFVVSIAIIKRALTNQPSE